MILVRMVGGILRPEIIQTLVRKRGVLVSLGWGGGGPQKLHSLTACLTKRCHVYGSSEA